MSNNQLPAEIQERIKADGLKYMHEFNKASVAYEDIIPSHIQHAYIAGATAEFDGAKQTYDYAREIMKDNQRLREEVVLLEQKAQVLVDALEGLLEWHNTALGYGLGRKIEAATTALEQWKGKGVKDENA